MGRSQRRPPHLLSNDHSTAPTALKEPKQHNKQPPPCGATNAVCVCAATATATKLFTPVEPSPPTHAWLQMTTRTRVLCSGCVQYTDKIGSFSATMTMSFLCDVCLHDHNKGRETCSVFNLADKARADLLVCLAPVRERDWLYERKESCEGRKRNCNSCWQE